MSARPAIPLVRRRLLAWFDHHRRDLPWRHTRDPYRIAVSEVMLQQTQVDRVVPKYRAWLRTFPTTVALASAPLRRVLRVWSGLGYNSRARRLREAARLVQARHRGRWPRSVAALEALPGFGPYTARAVASFAYHQNQAVIDTNVNRVIGRVFFGPRPPAPGPLTERVESLLPTGQSARWNATLMDFGAAVCTSRNPSCPTCPLRSSCRAYPAFRDGHRPGMVRRQSRFTGSDRFWRGAIVRVLLRRPRETMSDLRAATGYPGTSGTMRFRRILRSMVDEGLLRSVHGRYTIAD